MSSDPGHDADDRRDLVARVAALLAKAASTDHEPERRAFEAKAQALITRHQIDEGEFGTGGGAIGERELVIDGWGNATRGVVHLWAGVAQLNRCAVAHRTGRGWSRVLLAGSEVDAEVTSRLVEHLLPQLRLAILTDRPRSRMSYAIGWAHEVIDRLAEAQRGAAADAAVDRGPGDGRSADAAALVPTNAAAADALARAHTLRSERRATVDAGAYDSGLSAGQQADLGQVRLDEHGDGEPAVAPTGPEVIGRG
ncbi:MAG: DUF2786 domain-containing protein [Actinomycetota bacterium]